MMVRFYEPSDYPMVCEWWKSWRWECLPEEYLPPIGAIVSDDEADICAAWLYRTDSKFALIEWFISNPDARNKRHEAIKLLTEFLSDVAKNAGFGSIVVMVSNERLIRNLESVGFTGKHSSMTNMVRVL